MPERTGNIIYWMSRDQRVDDNWALLFAQKLALKNKSSLAVVFCLLLKFLQSTFRQYSFMLKGVQEVERYLNRKNIPFYMLLGSPEDEIPRLVMKYNVGALLTDFSPLNIKKDWVNKIAGKIDISFYEVDAHNIVPCWITSLKQEYSAYKE